MSDHPLGVALIKYACPICGNVNEDATAVALGSKFNNKKNVEKVESMHNKIVGFSEKPCKQCQSYIDKGAFFIIGIDPDKTDDFKNPYRTGHLVGIKRDSNFFKEVLSEMKDKNACYMDYREMEKIGLINKVTI